MIRHFSLRVEKPHVRVVSLLAIAALLMVARANLHAEVLFRSGFETLVGNRLPVANAGTDQVVYGGGPHPLLLIGERSEDVDGELSASWEQIFGPPVTLGEAGGLNQEYFAPVVQSETLIGFALTVTDNQGAQAQDLVNIAVLPSRITVTAEAPIGSAMQLLLYDEHGELLESTEAESGDPGIGNFQISFQYELGADVVYAVATADSPIDMTLAVSSNSGLSLGSVIDASTLDFANQPFLTRSDFDANAANLLVLGHRPEGSETNLAEWEHPQIIEVAVPHPDPGLRDPDRFLAFLNHTSIRFQEDESSAEAYYRAVDPDDERLTLEDWLTVNGFKDTGADAHAQYQNDADLGFARDMYMKVNPDGTAAGYVRNFPSLDHLQANEKLIATVTMEFSPSPGHPENYTKFFVYGPNGERLLAADLDGRGAKPVPGVCNVCHGGTPKATFINESGQVTYPDHGDTNAQFLPWDVDTFKFAATPGLSQAEQEQDFYELNQLAKATWPPDPGAVTGARWTGATATELVNGWYEDGPVFKGEFVPPGWNNSPEERELYLEVVGPNCRACHITRGTAEQHAIDLSTYDKFMGYAPLIRDLVYEQGVMPLASRTFGHFWSGAANSPAVKLAQALPAEYDLFPGTGESIKPGRPVVRYGVVTGDDPLPFKYPPDSRGVLHDGHSSLFSDRQDWRAVSVNRVGESMENFGNQAVSQSDPADSSQFRVVRQIADPASVRHTPFERNAAVGEITFFFDILPMLNGQCVGCHQSGGPIPNIPVEFDGDVVQVYKTVLDRINFEQPLQSLLLSKPGGFRHGRDPDKGAVLQNPVPGWDWFDDSDGSLLPHGQRGVNASTVANWISIGAPFWGNTSSGKSWTCQNVGRAIPDNEPGGLRDLVLAGPNQIIRELMVELDIDHANPNDLQVSLVNVNTGQEFLLLDRPAGLVPGNCPREDVRAEIWDIPSGTQTDLCKSATGFEVSFKPIDPLVPLDGRPLSDLWQLNVSDLSEGSTGVLNQWCIRNMVRPSSLLTLGK